MGSSLSPRDQFLGRVERILSIDPSAPAIEFGSTWYTWADLNVTVKSVENAFRTLDLPAGAQVGVLLRNTPASIGLILGVVLAGGCVVTLNPHIGAGRVAEELEALDLALIAGMPSDVDELVATASPCPTVTLAVSELAGVTRFERHRSPDEPASPPTSPSPALSTRADTAVRLLTSGTTGPPKRIDLSYEMLMKVLHGAKHYESSSSEDLRLRDGIVIVNAPLVHLGGLFRVLQSVHDGRRMSLLERFTVDEWVDRVRRHRPKTASLVPTALRMVLDANVDPDDLSSLRSVVSGTAPLDPDLADAFQQRYGVAVLTNYAATEFGGGVAGWNLADHQRFWTSKRGSVGRAHAGCQLRVVDPDTGAPLSIGEVGLLEVQAAQLQQLGWVRTSDLARLDDDGFLWIVGRADQTIIRGGLKVQPPTVVAALEKHPDVGAAAVVGIEHERLGEVPVAVVEPRPGSTLDRDDLLHHASEHLARYELPTDVIFVDTMPRTESAKIDLGAVRRLVSSAVRIDEKA